VVGRWVEGGVRRYDLLDPLPGCLLTSGPKGGTVSFLELRNLAKTFPDGTRAVRGIDLSVEQGEFIVLLGPSGCGKTTTLRMIAGLETPTEGTIQLDGENVSRLRPSERDVGFVFQLYALYPHLSVRENILFPLKSVGTEKEEQETLLEEVSSRLGLESLLGKYPYQLGGGDHQRVALARAMVRHPRVFLMDEPLGALDSHLRLEMREFIRGQQLALGVTTVYVTHDQEEAMSLADRIVVMDEGEIRQVGTPSEIYDNPSDLFVANFVGSPGMNLLKGEMIRENGTMSFRSGSEEFVFPPSQSIPAGGFVLGVRPEYVSLDREGPIVGKVLMNEYMGSNCFLHTDTALGRITARCEVDSSLRTGDDVHLRLDTEHFCFFDSATGTRVE